MGVIEGLGWEWDKVEKGSEIEGFGLQGDEVKDKGNEVEGLGWYWDDVEGLEYWGKVDQEGRYLELEEVSLLFFKMLFCGW